MTEQLMEYEQVKSIVDAFLRKIADGKLLMRFSYMTFNVTCDCCGSEQKLEMQGQPDTLRHKSWCVVVAARKFFADFVPSTYPVDLKNLPVWGMSEEEGNKPQFAWFEQEEQTELLIQNGLAEEEQETVRADTDRALTMEELIDSLDKISHPTEFESEPLPVDPDEYPIV